MPRRLCRTLPQKTTVSGLSQAQERALQSLLEGSTVTAAARAAKVDRTTVHRWQRDETFNNELQKRRVELQSLVKDRLAGMATKAANVIEAALDNSDAKTAIVVLKGLGFLADEPSVTVNVATGCVAEAREPITKGELEQQLFGMLKSHGITVPNGFHLPEIYPLEVSYDGDSTDD